MRQITNDHLTALLTEQQPPCISLYQPTHRHHPENQQDPIRYRNLLQELETSLRENRNSYLPLPSRGASAPEAREGMKVGLGQSAPRKGPARTGPQRVRRSG